MTFTHIVTFKWQDADVDDQAIADALQNAVAPLEGVVSYVCGPDVGFSPASYDFAVVGTFDSREHFVAYRDDPEHQRVIAEMIAPHVADRTFVQLEG